MTVPPFFDRTRWMSGRYGLMVHWLYPNILPEKGRRAGSFEDAVERFNLPRLMEDFSATGADWLIFTIGQNAGTYASPNAVIERLAGPGHCSQRDLALEIATEVHRLGKRFIAYLPCEAAANTSLHQGFAWNTQEGTDQAEFQRRYLLAVRAWAERFGALMDGWWFDGCYTWPVFHSRFMDWPAWFEASRAGSPERAVAFNDGSFCIGLTGPLTPEQDYLSGETEVLVDGRVRLGRPQPASDGSLGEAATLLPDGRFVPGTRCQWHSLLPIDCFWGHGNTYAGWLATERFTFLDPNLTAAPMEPPVYSDAELGGFLERCLGVGGAVSLNVGIYEEGHLGQETVKQLMRIGNRLGGEQA